MIYKKCKNCPALVIPYSLRGRTPNSKLSDEMKTGTCKCNVDLFDRRAEGYCGWCHPDKCKGPEHHYYFTGLIGSEHIKFID